MRCLVPGHVEERLRRELITVDHVDLASHHDSEHARGTVSGMRERVNACKWTLLRLYRNLAYVAQDDRQVLIAGVRHRQRQPIAGRYPSAAAMDVAGVFFVSPDAAF
jgi:hypothetical protein